jgi:hypothetical protein
VKKENKPEKYQSKNKPPVQVKQRVPQITPKLAMIRRINSSTRPAPFIPTHLTSHMRAASIFLNMSLALRALFRIIRKNPDRV